MMLLLGLRELQWSRRRFAVAVLATALVFALGLLMSGVSASFDNEIDRTVESFGADAWLLRVGELRPVHRARDHPGRARAGRAPPARRAARRPRRGAARDDHHPEPPQREPARRGARRGRRPDRAGRAACSAQRGTRDRGREPRPRGR